ncbi:Crp/Fnr family transcriptional regulator [Chondrinema litorale]|uniref:Crp/Fnr family transcriptional regulator n=1 Tax=Chondrinema litorale TaxID=2994555 RepID=UPI0025434384|nr:Crp/Fnr family transcriptional regulator [Chondrinema litorale]UZR96291.1 Crp/Fnr family transcriptional regulator [Chondrinema litorale]
MAIDIEIKKSLLKLYPFSEQNLDIFADKITFKHHKKKEFLVRKNQICRELNFVISGSFRLYTETEKGELTLHFFTENSWSSDLESLLNRKPSKNFIEAIEPSKIAVISLKDIHQLMNLHSDFHMLNGLLADFSISSSQIISINTKSPDKRYKDLLKNHPDWINRFPQKYIASYLGITPETLSRVRARVV